MKIVLSTFKVNLLALNHLFMTADVSYNTSVRQVFMMFSDYYPSVTSKENRCRDCLYWVVGGNSSRPSRQPWGIPPETSL